MASRLILWFKDGMSRNFRLPTRKGFFRRIIYAVLILRNRMPEEQTVYHCDIIQDHQVLELAFGPGLGLLKAYDIIKKGDGKLYGIDLSPHIQDGQVELFLGSAAHIPLTSGSIDRVFHSNAFMYWPDMDAVVGEIARVMKPGGLMVTSSEAQFLQRVRANGWPKYRPGDHIQYMTSLKKHRFKDVKMKEYKDAKIGRTYDVVFAEATKESLISKAENMTTETRQGN